MASVLHDSARRTPRLRAASKRDQPGPCCPLRPEREDGAQMAQADHNADALMGPKKPKSTVLTPAEEAIVGRCGRRRCCHWTTSWVACETRSLTSVAAPCTDANVSGL